ncbi:uncharacterized protein [Chironomus tepperi]|uniref:uncharacterized protein n=1 Tax=Chironomus tepperi TaxID=113505 RepID=UPI00391F3E33
MPVSARKRRGAISPSMKQEIVKQIKGNEANKQTSTKNVNKIQDTNNLSYDTSKKLSNDVEGEKYLILHRTDVGLTMKDMSAILLATALKTVTNNEKLTCRTLKSGDILVKTETIRQAKSLITLTRITNANIEVTEHRTLNTCRGVISAHELKYEDEATMLEYLKPQNVTKIDFHMKKVGNETIKSGLAFVTFGKNEPPEYLTIGYLKLKVRPYIPTPMRCFTCHKFGHITKTCPSQNTPKCYNCNEDKHLLTKEEKCTKQSSCVNCGSNEHNSYNRTCSEYKRQVTIQTIKVTQKVSFSEAVKRSNLIRNTYAQVTSDGTTNASECHCPRCGFHRISEQKQRTIIDYKDLNQSGEETEQIETDSPIDEDRRSQEETIPPDQHDQHTDNS